MSDSNGEALGEDGATRRPVRNNDERRMLRMVRAGWMPSDEKLDEIRGSIEKVAISSGDPRARIMAAKILLEAEVAIVNSANQMVEIEDSEAEEIDPEEPMQP